MQCRNNVVTIRNNVATLCCAKNRRCESSRGTSPLGNQNVFVRGQDIFSPSNESRKDPLEQFYRVLKLSTYFCIHITQKTTSARATFHLYP